MTQLPDNLTLMTGDRLKSEDVHANVIAVSLNMHRFVFVHVTSQKALSTSLICRARFSALVLARGGTASADF